MPGIDLTFYNNSTVLCRDDVGIVPYGLLPF